MWISVKPSITALFVLCSACRCLSNTVKEQDAAEHEAGNVYVQLLGMYDTGTTLLRRLLYRNFRGHITKFEFYWDREQGGLWKHSNLQVLARREPSKVHDRRKNGTLAIAMVRNPLSWLQSLHEASYELKDCMANAHWLSGPCTLPSWAPAGSGGVHGEDLKFPNIEEMWNNWTHSYENLLAFGFQRGLVIRYEDMVLDMSGTVCRIARFLRIKCPSQAWISEDSAKRPNNGFLQPGNNRTQATAKLISKSYLQMYSTEDLQSVCHRLDVHMMHRFQYTDCDAAFSGFNHSTQIQNQTAS